MEAMRELIAAAVRSVGSLATAVTGVAADEAAPYAKLRALLPPGPDAALCYARTYDAEHLKQHPQQKVTGVVLFLRYVTLSEEEATLIATDGGGTEKRYFRYDFTLATK